MRAALGLVVLLLAAGCVGVPAPVPAPTDPPSPTPDVTPTPTPTATVVDPPRFDADRALRLVHDQVTTPNGSVRYRVPGTVGNAEVAQMIDRELRAAGYDVHWHHFNATYGCETVAMHNVVGQQNGTSGAIVAFGAHYDTRPIADKDPDPARRNDPIVGANDGASGVAVLLELARIAPRTNDTLRFVFFDGEDGGGYKGNECTDWILGSRAYAKDLPLDDLVATRAFVLVDMVGDKELLVPWEMNSRTRGGKTLQDGLFDVAKQLGHAAFRPVAGSYVLDDHVPFLDKGVPAVDLIHTIPGDPRIFPPTHHTHADDLQHVSAASLGAVGETLEAWLRRG